MIDIVYIQQSRTNGGWDVYRCENGSQSWNVAQGLLSEQAAREVAVVVAKHMCAARVAAIDNDIANPGKSWDLTWGGQSAEDLTPEQIERAVGRWYDERARVLSRTPIAPENVQVQP